MDHKDTSLWYGTTILSLRDEHGVVVIGDGQVSLGPTIIKSKARKVRKLCDGSVIAGFAGATADAFALFERLEAKLEQYPGQLARACVEMAKDWRTDRYLRRLEAMLIVVDAAATFILTGNGDVLEPEDGVAAIGSGGMYALSAARGMLVMKKKLLDQQNSEKNETKAEDVIIKDNVTKNTLNKDTITKDILAKDKMLNDDDPASLFTVQHIAKNAMDIASDICVYTNNNYTVETLSL